MIPVDSDSDIQDLDTHSDTEVDYSPVPDRRVVVRREDHNCKLRSRIKRPRSKKQTVKPQRGVLLPPTSRPSLKVSLCHYAIQEVLQFLCKIQNFEFYLFFNLMQINLLHLLCGTHIEIVDHL